MDLKNTPNKATYMCSALALTNDMAVQSVAFNKSRSRCRSVRGSKSFSRSQPGDLAGRGHFASAAKLEVILPPNMISTRTRGVATRAGWSHRFL